MVCRVGWENYVGQLLDCLGPREPARGGRDRGGNRGGGGGRPEDSAGTEGGVGFAATGGVFYGGGRRLEAAGITMRVGRSSWIDIRES